MTIGKNVADSIRPFRHFFAAYPARSTLMLLALTAAALAEGVGIAALLPLIGLVIETEDAGGVLTVQVEQLFALLGLDLSLGALLALIVTALTLKSLLMLLAMAQLAYSASHAGMELRLALVRVLLLSRWTHIVDWRAGELASAVSVEPARSANAYISTCRVLSGGIQLLVYLALAVGALGMAALSRLVAISGRAGQNQSRLQNSFMVRLLQALDGMKPLKAMALEGRVRPLIEGDVRSLNKALRTIIVSREALAESHELIRAFAVACGLYVFVAIWGQPVDGLLVLALLFARTLQKTGQLQTFYQTVAANQPAFAFVQSTIAAAEQAREPRPGQRCAAAGFGNLAAGRELLVRPRQRSGRCLDDAARRLVYRRRRVLGRRQDDRCRPCHRSTAAPAWRGLDRRPAYARHRLQCMARHDRLCASGNVSVSRYGHG